MAAIGAGVGALAPSDASGNERFLLAALAALAAPLLAYAVALLWSLLRAPFRQRRELITRLTGMDAVPQPVMAMVPEIDRRERKPISYEGSYFLSVAFVRVYNAQEFGGEEGTARNVTPEVKVFGPGDQLLFHQKGWDQMASRDFTTGQEEHALWIAAKREKDEGCFLIQQQDATSVKALSDGVYSVEVTLRGYLPNGPVTEHFVLTSQGLESGLTFRNEES
jgi:hypothetical protein